MDISEPSPVANRFAFFLKVRPVDRFVQTVQRGHRQWQDHKARRRAYEQLPLLRGTRTPRRVTAYNAEDLIVTVDLNGWETSVRLTCTPADPPRIGHSLTFKDLQVEGAGYKAHRFTQP